MRAYTDRSDEFAASGRSLVSDGRRPQVPAPPAPPALAVDDDAFVPAGLSVLATRSASGFDVQLLIDGEGQTYVTALLNGACETFEVPRAKALDAFHHPFLYGCTLPL